MYLTSRQPPGVDGLHESDARVLRPTERFAYWEPARLAEPAAPPAPAPAPVAPAAPRGLALFDHFQRPRRPAPGRPGTFVAQPLAKLSVSDLNPGFIDASDNLIADTSPTGLQTCLQKLITTKFQNYLSSRSSAMPSPGDRVRIALVDLTGDKLTRPDFAGWGSTAAIYAASVAKILAVYAAHQLRVDLRMLAAQQSITTGAALEKAALQVWKIRAWAPNLVWLFDIRRWSGTPTSLDFSKAARDALTDIMHNEAAGAVIAGVGFPYMASVTWQSGLYHANRGGLWLSSSYGKGEWGGNPVPAPYSANATALSVATYFTLMAQRRLVDEPSSIDIETVLGRGCVTGGFPLPAVASKCGIWSNYLHDCALVVRGATRYVVVGLTRTNPSEYTHYKQLFLELDNLIVQNNQKPKPVC